MATNRQIPNCKVGLQHNIGLGGAAVVGIYRLGFPEKFKPFPKDKANPAIDSDTLKLHTPAPAAGGAAGGADLKSAKVFDGLKAKIAADPTLVSKVNAVYKFDVKGPNGGITSWIVDLKNGSGSVTQVSNTSDNNNTYIVLWLVWREKGIENQWFNWFQTNRYYWLIITLLSLNSRYSP